MTAEDKMEEIIKRYRVTEDLYNFMANECKFFPHIFYQLLLVDLYLPSLKHVTLTYLQQIMRGQRKVYKNSEVRRRVIPMREEFSVKVILAHKYCKARMIQDYFPKNAEIVNSK